MQNNKKNLYTGLKELLILESLKNYNDSIVYDSLKYSLKALKNN